MEVDPPSGSVAPVAAVAPVASVASVAAVVSGMDTDTRQGGKREKVTSMALDTDEARPVKVRPQKMKRGQRTGKQQKRKMKNKERALAVSERTSTKLVKGGKKAERKKVAKKLY